MNDNGGALETIDGSDAVEGSPAPEADLTGFESLLDYLHRCRGFDFTGYKRATLSRRIHRRMQAVGATRYRHYIDFLEVRPDEFPLLFNTILINVTTFFRDQAAWDAVRRILETQLGAREAAATPLRIWCAGCASGEEAYTLAILLAEILGATSYPERAKVYATDVDEEALAQARAATYTDRAMEGVPETLRTKYFTKLGVGYQINKDIRRGVIFGRHDLVQDAPISRIDLLTCRNALMYFNAAAQTRILKRFHFALNDDGMLFLGKAEMLLSHSSLFTPVDLELRLFTRTRGRMRERFGVVEPTNVVAATDDRSRLYRAAFDHAPTAQIVLDPEGKVALVNHRAARMFALTPEHVSRPFNDLEISYRPAELRSCLERVKKARRPLHLREVERVLDNGEKTYLDIELLPLLGEGGAILGTQLSFANITDAYRLQVQLRASHVTLEAMHEEIQSTSEELEAMNDELRQRGEELVELSGFMSATLGSMRIGVVVLDRQLLVRAWNRKMEELWGLRADEVEGKAFMTLDIGLPINQLAQTIRGSLASSDEVERSLDCINRRGKPIRCRVTVTPVRSEPNRGVTIVIEELAIQ